MRIVLNGQDHETKEGQTLLDLLKDLGLADRRVAALMDGEVVRRAGFGEARLKLNCKVEIIQMVGGG